MKVSKIHYSDDLEENLGTAFEEAGIEFVHESQNNRSTLDFYLPKSDIYIEVKKFHTDRVTNQLKQKENVILLQGRGSVKYFIEIIKNNK